MLVKPNWDNFKAKFSENPQDNFEWLCYLLFSKEYNQPYGTHRYKNQSGIETDPIEIGDEVIGWQSKFYEDTLSNHKDDLLGTLTKTKRDNPNITKIILYTNSEWGQGQGIKEPKAKTETQERADELNIEFIWRTKSYFESPFVCKDQREVSRYFFELDSKWEFTPYGFLDTLKLKYLNDFKTISLLTIDTPKSMNEIFVNLAIIKEQKKEESKDKTINRESLLSSYEEIHKPKEPIEIKELVSKSNKSLIYGKAGIGKTTLCKYIAYKWAKGELYSEFEYLIYIPLREWKSNSGIKGAICDYYYSLDDKNLSIDFGANKTLFLFDGYDELDADKKKALRDEIDKYTLTHYLITTRPYGYQKSDFRVDEYFETIGFTDENVEEYIDTFFKENTDKATSLKAYLETNISIKHISYIPLMLEMICSLWEHKEFGSDMTMTELYGQVIENMLKKHSANKDDERVYKRQNRRKIQEQLGKLAFKGLTQQSILFDGDFIEESIDDIDFFEKSTIYSGFLKSDAKEKDLLDNSFEFPHLTFQEYFSALYVAKLEPQEQSEIIRDWKFYPHMQMFFAFLSGLIENKEFLFWEIKKEPKDLVGFYELILFIIYLRDISKIELYIEKYLVIKLMKWLTFLLKSSKYWQPLELLLDELQNNNTFLNSKILDLLIDNIKDKECNEWTQYRLLILLISKKNTDDVLNLFINFIQDDSILLSYQKDVIEYVIKNEKYKKKFLEYLIYSLEDTDIHSRIKKKIAELLFPIFNKDNQVLSKIIYFVEDEDNEFFDRADIAYLLFNNGLYPNINETMELYINDFYKEEEIHINEPKDKSSLTDIAIENIINMIDKEDEYSLNKDKYIKILLSCDREDNKYIDYLFILLKDKKYDFLVRDKVCKHIFLIARKNEQIVNMLISFISQENLEVYIKRPVIKLLADLSIFYNDIFEKIDINNNEFKVIFIENCSIESFFYAFDNNYINLKMLMDNTFYNVLPLYLKNKKLHTIENGKEISTQRELDQATLNEIKMLLKGEDLND